MLQTVWQHGWSLHFTHARAYLFNSVISAMQCAIGQTVTRTIPEVTPR